MVLLRMPECGVAGGSHDSHFEAVGTQVSSEHCMNRQLLSLLYDSTSPGLRGSFHYPSKAVKMLDEPDQTCSQTLEGQRGEMGPGVDPQTESPFFQRLPQEIRDKIYTYFFTTVRLASGWTRTWGNASVRVKPRPESNHLALLRTCRRSRNETGELWLGQVLFSFEDPLTMAEKLGALPGRTLAKIRHVRVRGTELYVRGPPLVFRPPAERSRTLLGFFLERLPGLQLDQLTVLGGRYGYCDSLGGFQPDGLIQTSNGWKTLRYISPSTILVEDRLPRAQGHDDERPPQTYRELWQNLLDVRDGRPSKPSVAVYWSTTPGYVDRTRTASLEGWETYDGDDPDSIAPLEIGDISYSAACDREIMVIAERGAGVNYQQTDAGLGGRNDMIIDEWRRPRSSLFDSGPSKKVKYDDYSDVDDFEWTPEDFDFGL